MVKGKKGKKDTVVQDEGQTEIDIEESAIAADESDGEAAVKGRKKEKKKAGGKNRKESDEEAGDDDVEIITKDVKKLSVKKGKDKKKKQDSDEDEEDDEVEVKKAAKKKQPQKKGGFDLLMADLSDDDDNENGNNNNDDEEDDEDEVITKAKKNDKPTKKGDKKGKKDRKKRNDSDEDIDKVLAELELEYSGVKKPESSATEPAVAPKKENKKKEKVEKDAEEDENNEDDDDNAGGTVKTAAQKIKEKKERQKREAALLKQQQLAKEAAGAINEEGEESKKETKPKKTKEVKVVETLPAPEEGAAEGVEAPANEEDDDKKDDKKKKKKSKLDKKEEAEKEKPGKKKGISSAMVAAMQERLQKVKEEEERLKREEEERIAREEEAEDYRLEQIRLEAERKEKKKIRDQERKARLKAEGKLLTAKQKQDKARAQAMLDALRAQGVELPEVGEKRPRPGTRVRANKKKDSTAEDKSTIEDNAAEDASKTEENEPEEVVEEIVVEKVKDAWDASSSEDEAPAHKTKPKAQPAAKKPVVAEKSDSDDDGSGSDEDSDEDDDDEDDSEADSEEENQNSIEAKKEKAWERILKRRNAAEQKRTVDNLRAAVVCVLGHVDTGKTKILDKLRRTNVQDGEAGGITQQIGATNVPIEAIKEQTRIVKGFADMVFRLPGLLIIDTPGHESFSNLRNRGSSLCDIAILVVDIMHGLEPQTIESINLLKAKKTPFVVALNKIDRLYNWETMIRKDVREIIKNQAANTQLEFQQRTKEVIVQFAEQGLNAALFYDNPDPKTYVNLIPTSAITGEGMGNLLYLIVELCQSWLAKRLMYSEELLATVLEVKAIPGLGTTIDAILINGKLREGDTMLIAGTDGPIVTQIRSLLMPQPMKELRVKNAYVEYKEILAAQGVKIAAKELEKAIAGLNLYVANKPDEVEWCRDEVAKELRSALSHIKLSGEGVYVQASTLGSLEALLEFLRTSKIPYSNIRIGPVVKRDVMKASTMLEHNSQYATILAFDVKIERDAQELADSLGVKIFQADIIYHLFDQFTAYRDELKRKKREEFKSIAVFPCKLKILPQFIFNSRDPIVMGVIIENGIVKEGTPICVPSKEFLDIGVVTSIECNHKQVESARKGQEVCIKIDPIPGESPKMFGRHFDEKDILTSKISRQSIDACKDYFRDDLLKADWALMVELKKLFQIL